MTTGHQTSAKIDATPCAVSLPPPRARCVPSRGGILTGQYQNRFGLESNPEFRDPGVMARFDDTLVALVDELDTASPFTIEARRADHGMEPVVMDPDLVRHLGDAAAVRAPDRWVEMPSAAGHDANMFADHVPCGMVFIPSIGGVSHDFAEDSHEADIVRGCRVLADAVVSRLTR